MATDEERRLLKEAQAATKRAELSKAFVMNLINGAADGVIATDLNGKLRIYNRAAADIFGYPVREALADLHIRDLLAEPGTAQDILDRLRTAAGRGRARLVGHRVQGRHKDGHTIPISLNAAIVQEGGQEVAVVVFFRDLREMLLLAEAASRQKAVAEKGPEHSLQEMIAGIQRRSDLYDMRFGDAAVAAGLCTAAQVAEALSKQREIHQKTEVHVPIGRLMIQLDMITEDQRNAILSLKASSPPGAETAPIAEDADPTETEALDADRPEDKTAFDITVSADRLCATLTRPGDVTGRVSVEAVLARMAEAGIVHGLVARETIAAYLESGTPEEEGLVVARGEPPRPGSPPEVRFLFEVDPLRIGTVREDGTTDWKDRGPLPQVKQGDVLCEITPGEPGTPGTDVTGAPIEAPTAGTDLPSCGNGVARSEDGLQYTAAKDGIVSLDATNELAVDAAYRVEGDIGLETGHVDFAGHVEVGGTIQKGYRVYGHSLRAEAIQGAEVHIAGDIVVMGGIYDARIKCDGTLKAGHVHKSHLEVEGDLIIEREIIESEVETQSRCQAGSGRIVSSTVSAKRGIVARHIGSQAARPSNLVIGIDHRLQRQIRNLRGQIRVMESERKRIEGELGPLRRRAEEEAERLGASALEQDRCMVQLRELETEIDQAKAAGDTQSLKKLAKKQQYLLAKKEQLDAAVEKLMAQDEERGQMIVRLEEDLANAREGIEGLNSELAGLKEAEQETTGRPSVKGTGEIAAGTSIAGPHASLTLEEALQRAAIFETNKPDKEGRRQWRLEVSRA